MPRAAGALSPGGLLAKLLLLLLLLLEPALGMGRWEKSPAPLLPCAAPDALLLLVLPLLLELAA